MIKIKTIIFCATSFIVGYNLNLPTSESSPYAANAYKSSSEPLSSLLMQCESTNLQLTKHINEAAKPNDCTKANIYAPPITDRRQEKEHQEEENGEQDLKSQLTDLRNYYLENELKKRHEFLESINVTPENMHQALSENYKKDTIDNNWSPDKKTLLDDYIEKNELLRSLPNVESDCRSKQCKISILSDDQRALSHLAENLRSLTNTADFSAYSVTTDEKNHATSIYLDRKL